MNNRYFPPMPDGAQQDPSAQYSPFGRYAYMGAPTPDQRQQTMIQQVQQRIMGQPAQNAAQGAGQLAAGIGMGLANYRKQGEALPTAPGGAAPSLGTKVANFFTGRQNGGLF